MSTTSKFSSLTSSSNFELPSITSSSTVTTARQAAGADNNGKNVQVKKKQVKKIKQQQHQRDDPICSIAFCILMQIAILGILLAGIWTYWLHDWVLSAAYLSAGSQAVLLVILGIACCCCMQSSILNAIAVLALLVIGLAEFVMVVYVSVMDEIHECTEDCEYFGNTKEKYTFVCLHATFAVIHGIYIVVFCSRLCSRPAAKEKTIVATQQQKLPSAAAQQHQQRELQTHPIKQQRRGPPTVRSQSFHSSQASSTSKASSAASFPLRRSRSLRRRPRSRSLSMYSIRSMASTQFPETSSMQSYLPPMRRPTSEYTPSMISGCAIQHCPIAANSCNVTACPYYRPPRQAQQQQQVSMISQQQQPNYQLVPYYPPAPAPLAPATTLPSVVYPNYANVDPSRSVVIDFPQHGGGNNNNGGGFVEVQRIIINMPQINQNQAPYQSSAAVNQQPIRSVAAAPYPPPPQSSQSQQTHETVYYTSVIPISKK